MEDIKSCASRKRGDEHKIETRNDEGANCVTSIDTDSMVQEPQVLTPLRTEEGRQLRKKGIDKFSNRALYPREDGVNNTITSVQKDNLLLEPTTQCLNTFDENGNQRSLQDRIYDSNGVSTAITTSFHPNIAEYKDGIEPCVMQGVKYRIRKLTEREVFRLMDVSEEDIDKILSSGISKTAAYRLAGNSICCGVLYHIFRKMFIQPDCEEMQLSLF